MTNVIAQTVGLRKRTMAVASFLRMQKGMPMQEGALNVFKAMLVHGKKEAQEKRKPTAVAATIDAH